MGPREPPSKHWSRRLLLWVVHFTLVTQVAQGDTPAAPTVETASASPVESERSIRKDAERWDN
jgi:hypothetical protein